MKKDHGGLGRRRERAKRRSNIWRYNDGKYSKLMKDLNLHILTLKDNNNKKRTSTYYNQSIENKDNERILKTEMRVATCHIQGFLNKINS